MRARARNRPLKASHRASILPSCATGRQPLHRSSAESRTDVVAKSDGAGGGRTDQGNGVGASFSISPETGSSTIHDDLRAQTRARTSLTSAWAYIGDPGVGP